MTQLQLAETPVQADRWSAHREPGTDDLSLANDLSQDKKGHAFKIWFTLGLTGLALIGLAHHDEALLKSVMSKDPTDGGQHLSAALVQG